MRFFTFCLLLCCILLGLGVPVRAQSGEQVVHTVLTWQGYAPLDMPNGSVRRVPTFVGANYRPGAVLGTYTLKLAGTVADGSLRNAVYEPLSAADSRIFTSKELPTDVTLKVSTSTAKRQPLSFITIQPMRRNQQTGQAEKLVSFDYAYSTATRTAARGSAATARTYASSSVLNSGDWYKIGVPASGIYKLDKNFLKSLGIDVQNLDSRRLQVYGNATGLLPQLNSDPRPDDLVENAIYVSGGNNSTFGDNDYALFYARGPHTWTRDGSTQRFKHIQHLYTDTAYYFVRVGTSLGKRMATGAALTGASTSITTFTERQFYERDLVNLFRSGRQWLGELFDNGTKQDFPFSIPDLVTTTPVQVQSSVAASTAYQNSSTSTYFRVAINGNVMSIPQTIATPGFSNFSDVANTDVTNFSTTLTGTPTEVRVTLTYDASTVSGSSSGYLDYLEVNAQRRLRMSGKSLEFRSFENISANARSQFVLSDATDATVWDVTDPQVPVQQPLTANGTTSSFVASTNVLREYVAFKGSDFPTPRAFGRVPNQNLHALNLDGKLDLVIVCYPPFKSEAERLAQHRRDHDKFVVQVVTTSEVYNEFSSGGQDITAIRDLMKMVYDRAAAGKENFLLLFGDASFDYKADPSNDLTKVPAWWNDRQWGGGAFSTNNTKNVDKINQNYVPVYESRESFSPIFGRAGNGNSYSSDDYFGFLDDTEGYWREDIEESETIDIGIGRLPVRTPQGQPNSAALARDVVDKIIAYDSPDTYGKWRNRITFVADDGDNNSHVTGSSEPFANALPIKQPGYNVHKVYLDMYPQLISAAGQRSPDCNKAIDEAIEQGSLIVNYNGHGGPESWAEERIFTRESIAQLQNTQRLAFFVTATCDFSTYDNPEVTSAGEQLFTDTKAGAIAMLTTTRLALSNANVTLNGAFYNSVFQPLANGSMPRLGDVVSETKNNSAAGTVNRQFSLLGDPTTRLAYPEQTVVLRSVNGQAIKNDTSSVAFKSLDKVEVKGEVIRGGATNTNFTGTAQVTVYEKPSTIRTLGNESDSPAQDISVQENVVYDGQATVRNGQFSLSFVVPKDINYSLGNGKISLYASDATSHVDAHGSTITPIGGANTTAQADSLPPRIQLFMDTESFVFGGLTGPNTTLLAHLNDENGINTASSGVGHEITAVLDNDLSKLTILNDFYTAEVDNYQAGAVKYLFKELSTGPHLLRLKAWDTHNNSAEKEIEFIVANTEKLALSHVLNYPNPFSTNTTFHFDQNHSGDDLEVQVQVFTVSGKLVRTLRTTVAGSSSHLAALSWDGRDEYNDQLARGVYVYRVSVRSLTSNSNGSTASKYEKLVILN